LAKSRLNLVVAFSSSVLALLLPLPLVLVDLIEV
jgi:hypothetical protein